MGSGTAWQRGVAGFWRSRRRRTAHQGLASRSAPGRAADGRMSGRLEHVGAHHEAVDARREGANGPTRREAASGPSRVFAFEVGARAREARISNFSDFLKQINLCVSQSLRHLGERARPAPAAPPARDSRPTARAAAARFTAALLDLTHLVDDWSAFSMAQRACPGRCGGLIRGRLNQEPVSRACAHVGPGRARSLQRSHDCARERNAQIIWARAAPPRHPDDATATGSSCS